jgi:hypothetical protein
VLVPLLIAALAVAVPAAAPAPAGVVPPCSPLGSGAAAIEIAPASVQVVSLLNRLGEQTGRRMTVQPIRGAQLSVDLPVDSFVAEPAGGWLLYGIPGRAGSEVRAINLDTGCDSRLAQIAAVARAAVLDATATGVYVHAVEQVGRADRGVTRIDLATGAHAQAVPPFVPVADFGPVFATRLAWDIAGSALVVQSCGARTCVMRLLDTASGAQLTYAQPHGALIAATDERIYAFAAGHDRPAPVLSIDRASGTVAVVAEEVYEAVLADPTNQPRLRLETTAGWQELQP